MKNKKLLVLTLEGFQDHELVVVCSTLQRSKTFSQIDFFNPYKNSKIVGQHNIVKLETINHFDFDDYDAIFIPGGRGANILRSDNTSLEIIRKFKKFNKWIFAICDAPNVLFEKEIINEEKYTAFPIENQIFGKNYLRLENVVEDQKIITARSASTSEEFALKIVEKMESKEKSEFIKKQLLGL